LFSFRLSIPQTKCVENSANPVERAKPAKSATSVVPFASFARVAGDARENRMRRDDADDPPAFLHCDALRMFLSEPEEDLRQRCPRRHGPQGRSDL
jgi:hypothetical protein